MASLCLHAGSGRPPLLQVAAAIQERREAEVTSARLSRMEEGKTGFMIELAASRRKQFEVWVWDTGSSAAPQM